MTTLRSGLLLHSNNFLPESSSSDRLTHKLNLSQAKFQFRPSTARNLGFKQALVSNQRNPKSHLVPVAQDARDCSVQSLESVDECLSLLNLLNKNSNCSYDIKQIHGQFVKMGSIKSNSLIGNKLAISYLKGRGSLNDARRLFDEIPDRTVPAYAALIGSYSRSERWEELFSVLGLMVHDGLLPDKYLVPTILKACSAVQLLSSGKMVHGYVIRKQLLTDVFVGNALIDLYANCDDLRSSKYVFDTMRERDVVSWTALVSAYMDGGLLDDATNVFQSMQSNGVKPDLISWNALVAGFARNEETDLALLSLEEMQEKGLKPRVSSWNGIISGCVQNGYFEDALDVFGMMLSFPEDPNVVTVVNILPVCAGLKDLNLGKVVHGYALKSNFCKNVHVEGSLINMYSKCGRNDYAEKIFATIQNKNVAVWNEMIAGYVNEGKMESALRLLRLMQNYDLKPDRITFNTMLSGHARNGEKNEACKLLSEMSVVGLKPNIFSFNVLISGFQQSGLSQEALKLFRVMQSPLSKCSNIEVPDESIQPSPVTTTSAIAACADLSLLRQGKEIHGRVLRNGFEPNIFVSSALIEMYAKCHDIVSATKLFLKTEDRNTVTWNSLIAGNLNNQQPEEALKIFCAMLDEGLKPSLVTFMILLPACVYMGTLNFGRELHGYIVKSHLDEPTSILSSALTDMYAKCGCMEDNKLVSSP
ncbi:pentatricopeptide repeat-containing protein At1g19720-like [Cornus florida]|uniref:pentatricopeptide repeat-containing protein At1g19720-like n=1 Tax=Cornus florida TaxID=4283 RepID=UPI00289A702D|nr:pentatricopeptide repeat-containing protein At1g19720-like [Cornus florida]